MDDHDQFHIDWRSACMRYYWRQIVAQGYHEIDEVRRVNRSGITGNTIIPEQPLIVENTVGPVIQHPFFADADYPQSEELDLLQNSTYE